MSQLRQALSNAFSSSSARDLDIEYAALIAFRESLRTPEAVNQVIKSTNNLKLDNNPAELRQAIDAFDSNGNLNSQSAMYSHVDTGLIRRARNQLGQIGISDSSKADSKAASSGISDIDALAIDAVCSESNKKLEELFMPEFLRLQEKAMLEMESEQDNSAPLGKQQLKGAMKESADLRQKNREKSNAAIGKVVRQARKSGPLLDSSKGYAASTALTSALDKRIAEILKKKPSLAPAATASSAAPSVATASTTTPSSGPALSDTKRSNPPGQQTISVAPASPLTTSVEPPDVRRAEYVALRAFRQALSSPAEVNKTVQEAESLRVRYGDEGDRQHVNLEQAIEAQVFDKDGRIDPAKAPTVLVGRIGGGLKQVGLEGDTQIQANTISGVVVADAVFRTQGDIAPLYQPYREGLQEKERLLQDQRDSVPDDDEVEYARLDQLYREIQAERESLSNKFEGQALGPVREVIQAVRAGGETLLDASNGYAASPALLAAIDARMGLLAAADPSLETETAPTVSASSSSSSASAAPAAPIASVEKTSSVQPKKESAAMSAQQDKPSDVKGSPPVGSITRPSGLLAEYVALRALRQDLATPKKTDEAILSGKQVRAKTMIGGIPGSKPLGLEDAIKEGIFVGGKIDPGVGTVLINRVMDKLRSLRLEDDSETARADAKREPENVSIFAGIAIDAIAGNANARVQKLFDPYGKALYEKQMREIEAEDRRVQALRESGEVHIESSLEEDQALDQQATQQNPTMKLLQEGAEIADGALISIMEKVGREGGVLFLEGTYTASPEFLAAIDGRLKEIGDAPLKEEIGKVQAQIASLERQINDLGRPKSWRESSAAYSERNAKLSIAKSELSWLQEHLEFLQKQSEPIAGLAMSSSEPALPSVKGEEKIREAQTNASLWQERVAKHKWKIGGGALVASGVGAALIADAATDQSAGHHLKEAYDYLQNAKLPEVGGPSALDIFLIMGAGYLLYKLTDLIVDKISPNSAAENAENSAPNSRPKPQTFKKLAGLVVGAGLGAGVAAGASALVTDDNDPTAFFKTKMVDSDLEAWMLYAAVVLVAALIIYVAPKIEAAAERTNEKAAGKVADSKGTLVQAPSADHAQAWVEDTSAVLEKEKVASAQPGSDSDSLSGDEENSERPSVIPPGA